MYFVAGCQPQQTAAHQAQNRQENDLRQSQKKKFFEAIEGETREALKEAMIEEELSLDDMVELIVAMYLASKN